MAILFEQSRLTKPSYDVQLHAERIEADVSLAAVSEVVSAMKFPSILGGNNSECSANRFSVWASEPREVFQFDANDEDPFGKLKQILGKYRLDLESAGGFPKGIFTGGWIGYFSYDLDRYIEKVPKSAVDDLGMPLIRLCFYDRAICYDHVEKSWWIIALDIAGDDLKAGEKLAGLEDVLKRAGETEVCKPPAGDLQNVDVSVLGCNMNKGEYFAAIEKIQRHIYDGDVYQINFSQRFESVYRKRPVDLYHWQNTYNASPYAAYIDGGEFAVVSASPEMFLTVREGTISTKPIKGTRRRLTSHPDAERINEANFRELVESAKDQAELYMIIDLERNDLARICVPGSRFVSQPRTIETYPTVFHAVATIEGELRVGCTFGEIMRATFPGGSITGTPKIRSMEIIDDLEPTQRGVYTGSIGYVGLDGSVCLNIAIRTVIIKGGRAYVQTGGGIVADSRCEAEWEETITKARALLAGIEAVNSGGV